MKKTMIAGAVGALLALGAGSAVAAAPDWGKVEGKEITASTRACRRWSGSRRAPSTVVRVR